MHSLSRRVPCLIVAASIRCLQQHMATAVIRSSTWNFQTIAVKTAMLLEMSKGRAVVVAVEETGAYKSAEVVLCLIDDAYLTLISLLG